jgi:hypothetical protein
MRMAKQTVRIEGRAAFLIRAPSGRKWPAIMGTGATTMERGLRTLL